MYIYSEIEPEKAKMYHKPRRKSEFYFLQISVNKKTKIFVKKFSR